jgi:lipid II:glycine glycyltransferase (peptidoglycan interpeptide bridge formation enzyme)
VIDKTIFGYSVWDIPRGPLWTNEESVLCLLERIVDDARKEKCMEVYWSPFGNWQLAIGNWQSSHRSIYPTATRILDLALTEEELLQQMHPKGRYNIKVAEKAGVNTRMGSVDEIDVFYELLQSTGNRDGFTILPQSRYQAFLECHAHSFLLIAEHDKKPIAGLIGVKWNTQGIYYYGASDHSSRALMAPYGLQWEAMKHCKAQGCTSYDLLGISPPDAGAHDSWSGISDFKRKFGGEVVSYPKEQKIVLRPVVAWGLWVKRRLLG